MMHSTAMINLCLAIMNERALEAPPLVVCRALNGVLYKHMRTNLKGELEMFFMAYRTKKPN